MTEGTTVIVGAGAVLDFSHKVISPSVKNLTDEVLKLKVQKVDGSYGALIRDINDIIVNRLKTVGNPEVRRLFPPQLNFEDLLHVLEMCLSYSSCWHDEYLHWTLFPPFGTLIEPNTILKDVDTVEYSRAAYALEEKVMEIVNQYDTAFREETDLELWYRNFWRSMGRMNIFTLNYDSTIEESIQNYEDGFGTMSDAEGYSRFSPGEYYDNIEGKTTIAHLHGSILFSEAKNFPFEYSIRDLVKNKDFDTASNNRRLAQTAPRTQAKEEFVQPYIISGSRKTEKMVDTPYNVYLSDLTRRVIENNRLLIIGYSFGDLYLNEILGLGLAVHGDDFKVMIVDKYPSYIKDYPSLYQHLLHHCNHGMFSFISRIAKDMLAIEPGQKEFPIVVKDYNTPIVSKNGNLMICMTGFKDAVLNHSAEMKVFLSTQ